MRFAYDLRWLRGPSAPSPLRPYARAYACRGLPATCFALPWRAATEAILSLSRQTPGLAKREETIYGDYPPSLRSPWRAAHEIRSWEDLKSRLSADRGYYAFFHPRMPDEPLIFVQVALVSGMTVNIQDLLDESAPLTNSQDADTAVFYSITKTKTGLQGVNLGNFLIKRVVDDLARDHQGLRAFVTLSPVPGFRRYLSEHISDDNSFVSELAKEHLSDLDDLDTLLSVPHWYEEQSVSNALKPFLLRACAYYLVLKKTQPTPRSGCQS